ncbi:hypothetical protein [Pseudokineococcus lusitanus]|uniref:Uncharacterized protein n=1 Tax=Pseudokineococcus lusitanus TaxID=763993 RepID=A0A3N1HTJ5_9ACTN|nr:hypothetical protein [Pseudokineococcus lusitanus]ROP45841.1 hypothetical protein EDC03_0451 [Pseudokineococcus lusitanus]
MSTDHGAPTDAAATRAALDRAADELAAVVAEGPDEAPDAPGSGAPARVVDPDDVAPGTDPEVPTGEGPGA